MSASFYPERPKFFAQKFLRLLGKTCAANAIGTDACWLLTIIVTLEDTARYRRGITFYNDQLMPLLGFTRWHRLDNARSAAASAGWLHYESPPSGHRGKPGVYWVTIPDHALGIPDTAFDEGEPSTLSVEGGVDGSPKASTENVDGCVDARVDGCVEPSYPSPKPTPNKEDSYPSSCPKPNGPDAEQIKTSRRRGSAKGKQSDYSEADFALAEWFWNSIKAMQPTRKAPALAKWASSIRLMRERDGRTPEAIRQLIERVQRDSFWSVQVLSPDKLREKFDDLELRLKGSVNGSDKQRRTATNRSGDGTSYNPAIRIGGDF